MKTGWMALFLWLTFTRFCATSDPPKPWMTEKNRTKVLCLICEPPSEGLLWEEVTDLRVFRQLGQTTNMSLANMTTAMERSNSPPTLAKELPPLAQASYSGSFRNKNPSLEIFLPLEFMNKADTFYCNIYKTDAGADTPSVFSRKIATDSEPAEPPEHGPRFEIIEAHKVQITWQQKKDFQFEYASVERVSIDRNKRQTTAPQTLLIANGKQNMTFPSKGFLAATLDKGNPNYTLMAIFEEKNCGLDSIYTCRVPHPACFGKDEKNCQCPVPSSVTLESSCSAPVCKTTTWISVLSVLCVLLLVACIVMVVLYLLERKQNKKLQDDPKGAEDEGKPLNQDLLAENEEDAEDNVDPPLNQNQVNGNNGRAHAPDGRRVDQENHQNPVDLNVHQRPQQPEQL